MSNDGPRRRHSMPSEEAPTPQNPETNVPLRTPRSATERRASDQSSEDSLSPPLQPTRSRSYDHIAHVRFSSDIDNAHPRPQLQSRTTNTSLTGGARPSALSSWLARQRPETPTLSIDTERATEARPAASTTVRSPSMKSPESPTSPSSGPKTSPVSARARDRGYSLRRAIFSRNLSGTGDGSPSAIELGEAGPSNPTLASPVPIPENEKSTDSRVIARHQLGPETERSFSGKSFDNYRTSSLPHYESWIQEKAAKSKVTKSIQNAYRRAQKFVLRISEVPPSKAGRHITIDAARKTHLIDERTAKLYIGNSIRSSRYTLWSFFPRQLWAQFSRLANAYFLFVAILQMIPGLSTTGTYTTIIPLMFFVAISMAKEGYDDFRRYRLDKEENNRDASVFHAYQPTGSELEKPDSSALGPKVWASIKWKDVRVGDIVRLERDQAAPADLVLLYSSGEDSVAYIETMALDGETNLKLKQPSPCLARSCATLDKLATCDAQIVAEDPNLDLYSFEGRVTADGETAPLTLNEVIYRGSILRNTTEAFGLVVYSGEECKIRMNASKNPRIKAPSLQSRVNKVIIFMVAFVLALAVANSIGYEIWQNPLEDSLPYLYSADVSFIEIFVSFIIMFNTMIPLSLYVSLEITKVFQRLLLNDLDMYDEETDTPMEARTSTINEELGQISHIFSDKTGTLTDNCMKFRKMSVAGTAWLHDSDLKLEVARETYRQRLHQQQRSKKNKKRPSINTRASDSRLPPKRSNSSYFLAKSAGPSTGSPPAVSTPAWQSSARPTKAQREMPTMEMLHYIQRKPLTTFARKARFLLLSISLCHTCLPETKSDGSMNYQAASPDELALIEAAQEMGYMMIDRKLGVITVKTYPRGPKADPQLENYEILDCIEFSSKRKRMSVVVRFPDQRICIMSKGADSVMVNLLRLATLARQRVDEIDRKTSMRKSVEAREALMRRSEHHESLEIIGRHSMAAARASSGGLGRVSGGSMSHHSIHAHVDTWLNERERDVDSSAMDDAAAYSSRPSAQLERISAAVSDRRTSSLADEDFELVEEALAADEGAIIQRCFQHINDFATEGLRTLLYGHRFVDENEYSSWKKIFQEATTSIVDRQTMIERAAEQLEHGFELTGATAIEDKLQKGVPETIDKLRRANIKLWMLTGDKRETAINIGHSCRLIKDYSAVTVLDKENADMEKELATSILAINRGEVAHSVVVVDGQTLSIIENSPTLKSLFVSLAPIADSVICCRASPSQKALLVRTIRRKVKSSITLAIGDGANDIAMIQEAHVGIGITGKEGLQAARTSDYSIAQFRFLSKLLLVHGRWNYIRTCKYTLATFWKEIMFYFTQALYQHWVGYTGTSLYENWSLTTFNTLFTSLPVIILGVFEKDLQPATLLAVPELYTKGQRSGGFNFRLFAAWVLTALSESCLIYFLAYRLYGAVSTAALGNDNIFAMGDLAFTAVIVTVSAKLQLLEMHNISIANAIAMFLSVGGWFLWNVFLSEAYSDNTIYKVKDAFLHQFGAELAWWATLACILVSIAVLELSLRSFKAAFTPSDTDVFQVLEKDPAMMSRFERATTLELRNDSVLPANSDPGLLNAGAASQEQVQTQAEREGEIAELLRKRIGNPGGESPTGQNDHDAATSSNGRAPEAHAPGRGNKLVHTTSRSAPASLLDV